jgi:hypothetical protein
MSEKDKPIGTAEVALARMFAGSAQATEADQLRAIDQTIREISRDTYNPNALRRPDNVKVANAPIVTTAGERGSGWQEEKPLGPVVKPGSMEERVMSQMIDAALPPGGEKKDRK